MQFPLLKLWSFLIAILLCHIFLDFDFGSVFIIGCVIWKNDYLMSALFISKKLI